VAKFTYKKLKRRGGIWRVDGISEVRDGRRLGVGVTVHFAGIHETEIHEPYRAAAPTGEVLALRVHSATLSQFITGSVWKEGALAHSPRPHEHPLTVDVSQCRIVELDQTIKIEGRLIDSVIPENQHRFGSNRNLLAHTRYALLPVLNSNLTNWLIVPCSELLRFYFGVSSRLLSSTLRGQLDDYVSWRDSSYDGVELILRDKRRLQRKEAAIFCRAVASPEAKAAMFNVHKSLAAVSANNAALNETSKKMLAIDATFPFNDQTILTVAGKPMKLAGAVLGEKKDQWGFFAMQILHCPHSFGFSNPPKILSDQPFQEGTPAHGGEGSPPGQYPFLADDIEQLEVEETPANARLKRLAVLKFTNQFGAMDYMRFQHVRPAGKTGAIRPGSQEGVPIDSLSFGEGSHSDEARNVLGAGGFQNRVDQIDRDLTLFLYMIKNLRAQVKGPPRQWTVTTRPLKDGLLNETRTENIATFPPCHGRTWHKIVGEDGISRPRQVVIAEISDAKKYFYLLEMELRAGQAAGQCTILVHSNDRSFIDNKIFETLLNLTTIQNRWIAVQNTWKKTADKDAAKAFFSEFQIHRINHPHAPRKKSKEPSKGNKNATKPQAKPNEASKTEPEKWAELLLEKIDEIFNQVGP
jgi:hypothetical protein